MHISTFQSAMFGSTVSIIFCESMYLLVYVYMHLTFAFRYPRIHKLPYVFFVCWCGFLFTNPMCPIRQEWHIFTLNLKNGWEEIRSTLKSSKRTNEVASEGSGALGVVPFDFIRERSQVRRSEKWNRTWSAGGWQLQLPCPLMQAYLRPCLLRSFTTSWKVQDH